MMKSGVAGGATTSALYIEYGSFCDGVEQGKRRKEARGRSRPEGRHGKGKRAEESTRPGKRECKSGRTEESAKAPTMTAEVGANRLSILERPRLGN